MIKYIIILILLIISIYIYYDYRPNNKWEDNDNDFVFNNNNYVNKNIACCLCVRNCEEYLPTIFANLHRLSLHCKNFYAIFVYDNCTDNSEHLLKMYKRLVNYKVYIINIENKSKYRTVRISKARNTCLNIVYNKLHNIDFHIMIDPDDVNSTKWNLDILSTHLNSSDNWDSLSFNRKNYYDIWALLYDDYKHHCWGFGNNSRKVIRYMKNDIKNKLKSNNFYDCISAFNGFAIYKTDKFNNIHYDGYYSNFKPLISDSERQLTVSTLKHNMNDTFYINDTVEHCEHLFYHLSAIKQNNVRIKISQDIL